MGNNGVWRTRPVNLWFCLSIGALGSIAMWFASPLPNSPTKAVKITLMIGGTFTACGVVLHMRSAKSLTLHEQSLVIDWQMGGGQEYTRAEIIGVRTQWRRGRFQRFELLNRHSLAPLLRLDRTEIRGNFDELVEGLKDRFDPEEL